MKNKQGKTWIYIVVGGILVGLFIVFILVLMNQEERRNQQITGSIVNFYISMEDKDIGESLEGNYTIINNSNILKGKILKDSFAEIKGIPGNSNLSILCQAQGYYSERFTKEFNENEKTQNSSKDTCEMSKIGGIITRVDGNLREGNNKVGVEIEAIDNYERIGICVSWTFGVVDVKPTNNQIICESENWINKSYIQKNLFTCKEHEEFCESVEGNRCFLPEMEKPERYKNVVDKCFYTGISLKSYEEERITFDVSTKKLNDLDKVNFYVFDNEAVYLGNDFSFISEYQDKNLGNPKDSVQVVKGRVA